MFPGVKPESRVHVTESGTLSIQSARSEDSGEYSCQALNAAGSSFANAHITVTGSFLRFSVRLSIMTDVKKFLTEGPMRPKELKIEAQRDNAGDVQRASGTAKCCKLKWKNISNLVRFFAVTLHRPMV